MALQLLETLTISNTIAEELSEMFLLWRGRLNFYFGNSPRIFFFDVWNGALELSPSVLKSLASVASEETSKDIC
jgi:hypothetical protein